MIDREEILRAHWRARFMRPDAARFMRPDAARFLIPGTDPAGVYPALALKYSPSQRRVPAGDPRGGQWTSEDSGGESGGRGEDGGASSIGDESYGLDESGDGVSADSNIMAYVDDRPSVLIDTTNWTNDDQGDDAEFIQIASDGKPVTDIDGSPYYAEGGHHEMPKGVYKKWDLAPETERIFNKSTTGTLPKGRIPVDEDGLPRGHYWDGRGGAHDEYNSAVRDLSEQFMKDRNITPETMTPDQARDLLTEIRESEDRRIRDYNRVIRLLRRVFRFRGGRE